MRRKTPFPWPSPSRPGKAEEVARRVFVPFFGSLEAQKDALPLEASLQFCNRADHGEDHPPISVLVLTDTLRLMKWMPLP